jgi:hypothetical protein
VNGIAVAVSAEGTKMVPVGRYTGIFSSADSGTTWSQDNAPVTNWCSVACSADGCKLVAAVNGGGLYTWQTVPAPKLRAAFSFDTILLSWVLPSTKLVLQQAPDLTSGKWAAVAVTPALNYTNLQYQVSIPKPQGMMFYRLASQ